MTEEVKEFDPLERHSVPADTFREFLSHHAEKMGGYTELAKAMAHVHVPMQIDSCLKRVSDLASGRQVRVELDTIDRVLSALGLTQLTHVPLEEGGFKEYFDNGKTKPDNWEQAQKVNARRRQQGRKYLGGVGKCADCGTKCKYESKRCWACYQKRRKPKKTCVDCSIKVTNDATRCRPCYDLTVRSKKSRQWAGRGLKGAAKK